MKKIIGVMIGVLVLAGVGNAQSLVGCPVSTTPEAFSSLMATGCEIGDYQFTNFVITAGSIPAATSATFGLSSGNFSDFDEVLFNLNDNSPDINAAFTLTYTLTLDLTEQPASLDPSLYMIDDASAELQQQNNTLNGSWTGQFSANGSNLGSEVVTTVGYNTLSTGDVTGFTAIVLNVTDTFVPPTQGKVIDLSNTFTSDLAPEPSTMILLGVALIGLGVLVRKRRKVSV